VPTPVQPVGPPIVPSTPSTPQTPAQTGYDAVSLNFSGPGLLAGDTVLLRGQVHRGTADAPDTLAWETSDASVVSIETIGKNVVRIHALRSGTAAISARTLTALPELSRRLDLRVIDFSTRASPIVVDQFSILQVPTGNGTSFYQPMLRLRDTSATGTTKVIGLEIDVPQLGTVLYCSVNLVVGAAGWSAFNPPGDMNYGFMLTPRDATGNAPPTVRVTALLNDGLGVASTATGKTELSTDNWQWFDGADTGATCQN